MTHDGQRALWCEVLAMAIADALEGARGISGNRETKMRLLMEARQYITKPNHDFNFVCANAGFDPEVVRDRLAKQIADAPTPEQIVGQNGRPATNKLSLRRKQRARRKPRVQGPGVVSDFARGTGTGAGRSVQDRSNISFAKESI
ncbi:MAG: hypothetical protein RIE24_03670 [Silicimonas sp.]|uniref:hypothetical protein n=1 Tax=Alphaproteobacteria TaxID=28211 RepID=UPI0032F09BCC